jgi:hypothetical protein
MSRRSMTSVSSCINSKRSAMRPGSKP